jgi:hypothetical protein
MIPLRHALPAIVPKTAQLASVRTSAAGTILNETGFLRASFLGRKRFHIPIFTTLPQSIIPHIRLP